MWPQSWAQLSNHCVEHPPLITTLKPLWQAISQSPRLQLLPGKHFCQVQSLVSLSRLCQETLGGLLCLTTGGRLEPWRSESFLNSLLERTHLRARVSTCNAVSQIQWVKVQRHWATTEV